MLTKWYDPDDYANNLIKNYVEKYDIILFNGIKLIKGNNMNKKNILEKITELQEAVLWLENEATSEKTHIFYWEHLGPIYRVLTSLKKDIK